MQLLSVCCQARLSGLAVESTRHWVLKVCSCVALSCFGYELRLDQTTIGQLTTLDQGSIIHANTLKLTQDLW